MGSGGGIGGMGSGVSGSTANLVLVTGGAGYIGSHCCIDLLQAGYDVVVVSETNNNNLVNLCNGVNGLPRMYLNMKICPVCIHRITHTRWITSATRCPSH